MKYDVVVLGAGAAGMMCALEGGRRGRRVLLLEHGERVGRKILISGGGRCNFTNVGTKAENFLSENPHFAKSALARYTPKDFMALVEKHQILSLAPAKKSNNYAQRLLRIDPKFYDAYLAAGFSEYMVGSLPFFIKWFVHFDNVSGDKKTGIHNLELVASEGHYLKPFAKILLGIVALREKRPRDAQKLLRELAANYPQNPLFRRELDKLNAKIGAD